MARFKRNRLLLIVGMILVGWHSSASAQPEKAEVETAIDLKASRVYVFVDKKGLGHQHGVEGTLESGSLSLGATSNAGRIVFDMTSFKADTPSARKYVGLKGETDAATQKTVNEHMLGKKVLDVETFPTATFEIDSSRATGTKSAKGHPLYELKGNFTLHGTTQPLDLVVEAIAADKSTRLRGEFKVLQTDYDMKPYSTALGAVGVADELKIWGDIELKTVTAEARKSKKP